MSRTLRRQDTWLDATPGVRDPARSREIPRDLRLVRERVSSQERRAARSGVSPSEWSEVCRTSVCRRWCVRGTSPPLLLRRLWGVRGLSYGIGGETRVGGGAAARDLSGHLRRLPMACGSPHAACWQLAGSSLVLCPTGLNPGWQHSVAWQQSAACRLEGLK